MRKPRILIADDDTMVRIGLKTVINWEENGFVLVGEAANGLEAMQLVQEKKPDIVITDIKMPGMDGIELIRQLRQQSTPPGNSGAEQLRRVRTGQAGAQAGRTGLSAQAATQSGGAAAQPAAPLLRRILPPRRCFLVTTRRAVRCCVRIFCGMWFLITT